jgi:mitogen-activated protein kinase kinase kinase
MRKGTNGFIAPEILEDKIHTTAVDIFSAGCIILNMITGETPDLTNE